MAVTTTYSALYDSDNKPKKVWDPPFGSMGSISIRDTIAVTQTDDVGDFSALIPVANGTVLTELTLANGDLDTNGSPTVDLDVVLRATDKDGTNTDTTLFNAGTFFQSANTTARVVPLVADDDVGGIKVSGGAEGYCHIGLKAIATAATAAADTVDLVVKGR